MYSNFQSSRSCEFKSDDIDGGEEDNITTGLLRLYLTLLSTHSVFINEIVAL
jgi:hypothetical protein